MRTQRSQRTVVTAAHLDAGDIGLKADELDDKYNPSGGGEHPIFTRAHWRHDVADELTVCGYWEWVSNCVKDTTYGDLVLNKLH